MFKKVYSLYSAFCTQPAFYSQSAVFILHSVCILPLVRSLRLTLTVLITWPISNDLSLEVKLQNALAQAEFWSSRVETVKQVPQTIEVS